MTAVLQPNGCINVASAPDLALTSATRGVILKLPHPEKLVTSISTPGGLEAECSDSSPTWGQQQRKRGKWPEEWVLELGFHGPDEPGRLSPPIREFFSGRLWVFCFHCEIFSLSIKGNSLVMCFCMYLTVQYCPVLGRKVAVICIVNLLRYRPDGF